MKYDDVVKVRLNHRTAEALRMIAKAEGTTISALLRQRAEEMTIPVNVGEWE